MKITERRDSRPARPVARDAFGTARSVIRFSRFALLTITDRPRSCKHQTVSP